MRFLHGLSVGLALVPILAACSGDDEAATKKGPITIEQLRDEYEAANCEFEVRCTWMPDTATCKKYDQADFGLLQLINDAVFDRVAYDATAARLWVEMIRIQPCQDAVVLKNDLKATYRKVFAGHYDVGTTCFVDEECKAESLCDTSACGGEACCAGVCTAPAPRANTGEPCGNGVECKDTDACGEEEEGSGVLTCIARADNGMPCKGWWHCKDGMSCDVEGSGTCYKLSPPGGGCNPNLPTSCLDYSNWCEPVQKKCIALPKAGEPCGSNSLQCALSTRCDLNATNTCKPLPVLGEACGGSIDCLGDLQCASDVCIGAGVIQTCNGGGEKVPGGSGGGSGSGGGGG